MKSVTLAIVMSATIIGCSGGVDEPGNPNPGGSDQPPIGSGEADQAPIASGESEKNCGNVRPDLKTTITVWGGEVGNWGCMDLCQAGSFAYAVDLKSEPQQGSGDDTAVNGVSLECYNRWSGDFTGWALSSEGPWGNWLGPGAGVGCFDLEHPMWGAQAKYEIIWGSGIDDMTLTGMRYKCIPNHTLHTAPNNTPWGHWMDAGVKTCPEGSVVCGIQTRVEPPQGSGVDDTALGGVKFACCTF
jgi:hypothetical protein